MDTATHPQNIIPVQLSQTIVRNYFARDAASIRQFPTGLSHFVFDVAVDGHTNCVVRIARPQRKQEFIHGLYWHEQLEKLGVPLPELFQAGEIDGCHFAIYERLAGDDLENVYGALTIPVKKELAVTVAGIQQKVHALEIHIAKKLYPQIYPWIDVLETVVRRSEHGMQTTGLGDARFIGMIRNQISQNLSYLHRVEPVPFLYDLSVRNVIVDGNRVTGIIDVDELWLGDPLLAVGRGKTLLLMMEQDTDFITYWCDFLALTGPQLQMVDLYALLYAIRFLGTLGHTLNGNDSIQTDPGKAQLLEEIAHQLLTRLN